MQLTYLLLYHAVCDVQSIQSLVLDDLKLKTDLNVLLSALGSNTTLTELDIRSEIPSYLLYIHLYFAKRQQRNQYVFVLFSILALLYVLVFVLVLFFIFALVFQCYRASDIKYKPVTCL